MDTETYERLGLHESLADAESALVVNGRSNGEIVNALATPADRQYHPCPEAFASAGVPVGAVNAFVDWTDTDVFAGTKRDLWIYTPPGFDAGATSPPVMVFNDGGGYLAADGAVRAVNVFDNLIYRGEMSPTIGVFVMPGRALEVKSRRELEPGEPDDPRAGRQRSFEYDSVTDRYSRFLLEDLLPFVESTIDCTLSVDPDERTLCGISSGGICAFTAAWFRPESFGRVLSHCGSYTAIRGGHHYPYLIRRTERKPIRIYMQSGASDADIIYGHWPMANQQVAAALRFAGYDVHFAFGEGGHNLRHGGAVFADSLRWLWAAGTPVWPARTTG